MAANCRLETRERHRTVN